MKFGIYRKISIIQENTLGLYLFKRLFLLGLFSRELIFGGACYRKLGIFRFKMGLACQLKQLKQLKVTFHGLIFRRAYYQKDICV